ncbi:MAG: hypothetical protein JST01_13865 [Cyanobacteria bacterium SZAS TMP-1]|nr:hypothetical protein [Cyanobacteria bacterium SZAS TMP-1]
MLNFSIKKWWRPVTIISLIPLMILGAYVLSIIWRVSLAEQDIFGRSELIKLGPSRALSEANETRYMGQPTYRVNYEGKNILVFRQKINGYQHMFGSALADFELGTRLSRLLFAANEWAEFCFDFDGVSTYDLMDRRKDLANDKLGRKIGELARQKRLSGQEAEIFIKNTCIEAMDNPEFLPYFVDRRYLALGTEASLGCPYLPRRNIFNWLHKPFRKHPH